jgi:hypothetical protein
MRLESGVWSRESGMISLFYFFISERENSDQCNKKNEDCSMFLHVERLYKIAKIFLLIMNFVRLV